MKKIFLDEQKQLQLDMLDYIDYFCRKNDIRYTLSGGSLLGAIRHGGYIPWDDDMDIQMLRSEYVKFTRLWNEQKESHPYTFISIESGNNIGYPYGKISNPKTVIYYSGYERTGIFIDVFPIDNVIDMADFTIRHKKIKKLYNVSNQIFAWQIFKISPPKKWNLLMIIRYLRALIFGAGRSRNKVAEKINKLSQQNNHLEGDYVFEMIAGNICRNPIPRNVFEHYQNIKFEDRTYMAVVDYDAYLTATFGDYMTPPPESQRRPSHGYDVYWL